MAPTSLIVFWSPLTKLTEETRKRLEIMVQTNDGFEIAEADLKLRGPGDLEGTQQSGVAFDLKIADIARDGQLLQYVREIASRVVDETRHAPGPRMPCCGSNFRPCVKLI